MCTCRKNVLSICKHQSLKIAFSDSFAGVELNSGLSTDFSIQLNVSLSESLSRMLSYKVKSPNVLVVRSGYTGNVVV